jgi:hypothetical protein
MSAYRFAASISMTIALATFLLLGAVAAPARAASAADLHGTWRLVVQPVDCATSVPAGPSFASLLSFGDDGTLVGTTRNGAFQPGQRTSDFGTWSQTGRRTFKAVSEAFILFDSTPNPPVPTFKRGTHRITQAITIQGDRFRSVAVSDLFDSSDVLLMSLCAQATGTRLE